MIRPGRCECPRVRVRVCVSVASGEVESILGRSVCQAAQIGSDSSPVVQRAPLACRQTEAGGSWEEGGVAMT